MTSFASATWRAVAVLASNSCGSWLGWVRMLTTSTLEPPICRARSPYTLSAATTLIGAACAAEMPSTRPTSPVMTRLRMFFRSRHRRMSVNASLIRVLHPAVLAVGDPLAGFRELGVTDFLVLARFQALGRCFVRGRHHPMTLYVLLRVRGLECRIDFGRRRLRWGLGRRCIGCKRHCRNRREKD